jgi:hypothetical protein
MAQGSETATPADWALYYAKAGIRSFPVQPGKKVPMYRAWPRDATTDPKLIRQWQIEDRNLGLVAGEVFDAWDIEIDHVPAFCSWMYANGHLMPEAPVASTGRGGMHILTQPTGVDGSRNLYLDGKHIGELKSRGGFILACPSVTEQMYLWTWLPDRMELPEAPAWLLGLLERPTALRKTLPTRLASPDDVVAVLGRLAGSVTHAGEGRRNNYLYWAMRRAIEEGVPERHARKVLEAAAEDAGLEAEETQKTLDSAIGAESVAA